MKQDVIVANTGTDFRQSTDAAGLCGAIVKQTAKNIQGRKYVTVEGWQAIAIAHGCAAGSRDVERIEGGVRAVGEIRNMATGQLIAVAEGFVGEDEPTWYGGKQGSKTLPKRADYAIRAMAQTRAISRACRSAFAHVVVMIDADLATTPFEEVPEGGFIEHAPQAASKGMPDEEYKRLTAKMKTADVGDAKLLETFGVTNLRFLSQDQYAAAMKRLDKTIADKAKAATNEQAKDFGEMNDVEFAN